ncbi:hypothetical protein ECA0157_15423, partial [Escherichia coli ECA-0157]
KFALSVKHSQEKLLDAMNFESLLPHWVSAFNSINGINLNNTVSLKEQYKEKKIAVILPVGYLGGSLRGAI